MISCAPPELLSAGSSSSFTSDCAHVSVPPFLGEGCALGEADTRAAGTVGWQPSTTRPTPAIAERWSSARRPSLMTSTYYPLLRSDDDGPYRSSSRSVTREPSR